MALKAWQKYPLAGEGGLAGYRLDHPNLGDVYRTVYAKGVIKEFQKLQDDPILVTSLVKVEVDGQEYPEYLPLFFRPKAQYWDNGGPATAFNEDSKYYEKAWMSFRGDDEVAVLLQASEDGRSPTPFAVIGFTDGVPRIGEDVVKMTFQMYGGAFHSLHLQSSKQGQLYGALDEDKRGPDGFDLGLVLPATLITKTAIVSHTYGSGTTRYYQYFEWLIPVGAIIYLYQMAVSMGSMDISQYQLYGIYSNPDAVAYPELNVETKNKVSSIEAGLRAQGFRTYYTVDLLQPVWVFYLYYAAPVTGSMYSIFGFSWMAGIVDREQAVAMGQQHSALDAYKIWIGDYCSSPDFNWFVDSPGFTWQSQMSYNFFDITILFPWVLTDPSVVPDPQTFRFIIRPHTKAELQGVGLWPKVG